MFYTNRFVFIASFLMIILFSISVQAMPIIGQYAGPDTLPNGLQLTDFRVQGPSSPKTGDEILVTFRLMNVSETPITFDPRYGVFVGARWNSTTDKNNRDFGHNYKGTTIVYTNGVVLQARKILDKAGTWRFWPAFNINGKWGPFRWHEIVVEVVQGPPPPPGPRPPSRP